MSLLLIFALFQTVQAPPPLQLMQPSGSTAAPVVITLQDALERAKNFDVNYQAALLDAALAKQDRLQSKASLLPSVSATTQYLGTQGNGVLPSGRFVSNDGVHVYRAWGVLHEDLSANTVLLTAYKHSIAGEALAQVKVEIAQRGLNVTVTKNYYALVTAERRYATAQQAVQAAQRFFELAQQEERLGQVAHADAVKAELQFQQQRQGFEDATLAMAAARVTLAVMLFPAFNENFTVVDDLDSAQALPAFPEVQQMAEKENPDLRAALEAVRQSTLEVRGARNAFFPSLTIDADYGIEANAFALHSSVAAFPEAGVLPNLGYFITAVLNVPVWDWGTMKSKVQQSQFKAKQAQVQLSQTQRQLAANLYLFYNEAVAARSEVSTMRHAADLATESLRLTNLRYQAGEASALEVVDAQNAAVQAHNTYDDAQARYRLAISQLQILTGGF